MAVLGRATGRFAPGRRRAWASSAVAVAIIAALVACGGPAPDRVRPLAEDGRRGVDTTASSIGPDAPNEPAASEAASEPAAPQDVDGDESDDHAVATVRDVLARYDRVVTALHRDPGTFLRAGDPVLAEWAAVVPPGAVLADDIRSDVLGRLARGESIPPTGDGLSYVHHVVDARPDGRDRVTFTWCGWSPGIVRDVATGAVVDDGVGASQGTGTVERAGGGWVLASLDQTSIDVLPPGSPDPCPTTGPGS